MKKRIGLFGGTFDPIHFGHLQLAEIALTRCNLQEVLFIPAASPPHKNARDITPFQHRVEMIAIALAGKTGFELSLLEASLPEPSYTIDTITFLITNQKEDEKLYFILGEDAFLEIESWKAYQKLLSLTNFIVFGRTGYSPECFQSAAQSLGYLLKGGIWYDPSETRELIFLPTATDNISSSTVREKIRKKMSLHNLIPEKVINYIKKNSLYEAKRDF